MIVRVALRACAIGLIMWFMPGAIVNARGGPVDVANGGQRMLRFELRVANSDSVLYEPIVVRYGLRNSTSESISTAVKLGFEFGEVHISIRGPEGSVREYGSTLSGTGVTVEWSLGPGETVEEGVIVLGEGLGNSLWFCQTGTYEVRGGIGVWVEGDDVEIRSDPVSVSVREPSDADEAFLKRFPGGAGEWVKLYQQTPGRYCGSGEEVACFERLRSVVRDNPESSYSPYLLHLLAGSLASGSLKVSPSRELAIELYEEYLNRWVGHALRGSALTQIAFYLGEVGNLPGARQYMQQLVTEFPARKRDIKLLGERLGVGPK